MSIHDLKMDSPQDVAFLAGRMGRAVTGQIHRIGAQPKSAVDLAFGAWESVATRDNINELATRTMQSSGPADIIARLQRDALVYLNDCLKVARDDAPLIHAAKTLLNSAVGEVLRHA